MAKVGVWLIGAQGSLAATVVLGARAIARKLAAGGGLVTELPEFTPLPLVEADDLVFGGWDLVPTGLVAQAHALASDAAAATGGEPARPAGRGQGAGGTHPEEKIVGVPFPLSQGPPHRRCRRCRWPPRLGTC